MEIGDLIKLHIDSIDIFGQGVGRYQGRVVFVPYAACGDTVDCEIIAIKKRLAYGRLLTDEVSSDCKYFAKCGGCNFRHIPYYEEIRIKTDFLLTNIIKSAPLVEVPHVEYYHGAIDGYRNSVQYHVMYDDGGIKLGFYRNDSHNVVPIDSCLILDDGLNQVKTGLEKVLCGDKLRHVVLKMASSGHVMVILVGITSDWAYIMEAIDSLVHHMPCVKSVYGCCNKRDRGYVLGGEIKHLYGDEKLYDTWNGIKTVISPTGFIQVNHEGRAELYAKAGELARLSDAKVIYDLYCGCGGIGMSLGVNGHIVGVDATKSSIDDAAVMAGSNGIDAEYHCGKVEDLLPSLVKSHGDGLFLVDPPRMGLDKKIVQLLRGFYGSIIYISCNPATFARDVALLCEGDDGYKLTHLSLHDMFPRTGGVEVLSMLERASE